MNGEQRGKMTKIPKKQEKEKEKNCKQKSLRRKVLNE